MISVLPKVSIYTFLARGAIYLCMAMLTISAEFALEYGTFWCAVVPSYLRCVYYLLVCTTHSVAVVLGLTIVVHYRQLAVSGTHVAASSMEPP